MIYNFSKFNDSYCFEYITENYKWLSEQLTVTNLKLGFKNILFNTIKARLHNIQVI